jgi:hypothetical protein
MPVSPIHHRGNAEFVIADFADFIRHSEDLGL